MNNKILCVDDEPNLLASIKRIFRNRYDLSTSNSGEEALNAIKNQGPFAVLVSDLMMPGMNGIELLGKARVLSPETVQIMLTGSADVEATIEAVNTGNIFRFLTKPCPPVKLIKALNDSIEQYRLVRSEKELLGETLAGCVKVLVEILGIVNPDAFSRSSRVKRYVSQMAKGLKKPNAWEYEIAAYLSQLGCVAIPAETLDKVATGKALEPGELSMYSRHPRIASSIISKIPRLNRVAEIISGLEGHSEDAVGDNDPEVRLGTRMIRLAYYLDDKIIKGSTLQEAILDVKKNQIYPNDLVQALNNLQEIQETSLIKPVTLNGLRTGMILNEDVLSKTGLLLVPRGQEVNMAVLERLRAFAKGSGVKEPIKVQVSQFDCCQPIV